MDNTEKPMLSRDIFEKSVGADAHAIINTFIRQAKNDGWQFPVIAAVVEEAKDGDYDHLIQTFMKHCP